MTGSGRTGRKRRFSQVWRGRVHMVGGRLEADKRSAIRQRKPLSAKAFLDLARCRSVSPPLCRLLKLVADAEESASCDGG